MPSRLSGDLAGRAVALAADIPAAFDAPLGPHHKAIGRWLVARDGAGQPLTRGEARRSIEKAFNAAVLEVLDACKLAELRVIVLQGDDGNPPALAMICDSMGQIDLGWIEKTNVLSNALTGSVAPVGWRAAAYKVLDELLGIALPVFGYEQFLDDLSAMMWDGERDDESARKCLVEWHGWDERDELTLPSTIAALRPDYMLAERADPLKDMPQALRQRFRRLRTAFAALRDFDAPANAWRFDFEQVIEYLPHYQDGSTMPPLTLVPVEQFGQHVDEIARYAMESCFFDVVGLCPLINDGIVEQWFASLHLGAEFLAAAQDLIDCDPTQDGARA